MSTKSKKCRSCNRRLSVNEFYTHPSTRDHRLPSCKKCHSTYVGRRYNEDPAVRRRVIEQATRWNRKNQYRAKALAAVRDANSRAEHHGLADRVTAEDVSDAWERCEYRCAVCGKDLGAKDRDLTIDHESPMEFGGSNEPGNLRAACRSCNSREYWRCRREQGATKAA